MIPAKSLLPPLFVFLWSTGFVGARYAMPWAEPFTFLALRFSLAAAILAGVALIAGSPWGTHREIAASLLAGLLLHGIYLGGVFWAVHAGLGAGPVALIAGLQPLITTLLAGLLLGERILAHHWLGLAAGFAGVVTVILPKLGAGLDGITLPMLAAALVAVISISAGTVVQKRLGRAANLVTGTCWQYVGALVPVTLGAWLLETRTIVFTLDLVLALTWLVLVLSIGAIFLLMLMIREGAVSKVSSLFYLVPAVTAVIAWFLFGETLGWIQVAGMALATFGVALAASPGLAPLRPR